MRKNLQYGVHVSDIQCTLDVIPYDEKTLLFFFKF
jgi:hypothetical protein